MPHTIRSISLVDKIELEFPLGNVMNNSVCLGDVDNDGHNELVVGTTEGAVYVYKGSAANKPWCQWTCPGGPEGSAEMVSCLTVGDVCNKGKNVLAVLTTGGWIHLFDIVGDSIPKSRSSSFSTRPQRSGSNTTLPPSVNLERSGARGADSFASGRGSSLLASESSFRDSGGDGLQSMTPPSMTPSQSTPPDVKPVASQRFSFNFNAKIVITAQVCTSDCNEQTKTRLIVAYTDRVVRLFTWQDSVVTTTLMCSAVSSPFEEVHFTLPNNGTAGDTNSGQGSGDKESGSRCSSVSVHSTESAYQGAFKCSFFWTLSGQIDSLTNIPTRSPFDGHDDGECPDHATRVADRIVASQPGGKFATLIAREDPTQTNDIHPSLAEGASEEESREAKETKGKSAKDTEKGGADGSSEEPQTKEPSPTSPGDAASGSGSNSSVSNKGEHFPLHGIIRQHLFQVKPDRSHNCVSTQIVGIPQPKHYDPSAKALAPKPQSDSATDDRFPGFLYVITTLDGNIAAYASSVDAAPSDDDGQKPEGDKLVWTKQLDHQFYFLQKVDPSHQSPQFAACSWDGRTVLLNADGDMLKFHVEDSISAFCVGRFGVDSTSPSDVAASNFFGFAPASSLPAAMMTSPGAATKDKLCFVYVTTNGKIIVYLDVFFDQLRSSSLLDFIETNPVGDTILNLMDQLGASTETCSEQKFRDFVHYALYCDN